MIKAKNSDVTRVMYGGSVYSIHDAYPTRAGANGYARDLPILHGPIYPKNYTKAVVVDLGKDAGRLRYGVFVAKGRMV